MLKIGYQAAGVARREAATSSYVDHTGSSGLNLDVSKGHGRPIGRARKPLRGNSGNHTLLAEVDPEIYKAIQGELNRQQNEIELIASENLVSLAVMEAQGSVLTNKTVEGYPGNRYHGGAEHVDAIERLAIDRAKRLFDCAFANVQPHSGSQANQAVFLALLNPGDSILSMSLTMGGHLSHGAPANLSGKWFKAANYGVTSGEGLIDHDQVERLAKENKPKLIIAGGSSYPRLIDYVRFREITDEVGACLLVDMAHFAGLVAGGAHPSPFPHADIVTTTTYKNLGGPRGGLILTNDKSFAKKLDAAIFPGMQGTPMMHAVAAKAVCFGAALRPEFRDYAASVLKNADTLAKILIERGFEVVTNGTDTPIVVVDLRKKGLTGDISSKSLEAAGITSNKNLVPGDPEKPTVTSGLRFGTSAATTRGFGVEEFTITGRLICDVLEGLAKNPSDNRAAESAANQRVIELCQAFPIY